MGSQPPTFFVYNTIGDGVPLLGVPLLAAPAHPPWRRPPTL